MVAGGREPARGEALLKTGAGNRAEGGGQADGLPTFEQGARE